MAKKARLVLEGVLVASLVAFACTVPGYTLQVITLVLVAVATIVTLIELLGK